MEVKNNGSVEADAAAKLVEPKVNFVALVAKLQAEI